MGVIDQVVQQTGISAVKAIKDNVIIPKINEQVEPDFTQYEQDAQKYLDRPVFEGTPLSGKILADAARNTYITTGKFVPIDLALSQAQMESHMGTRGRNPKTNPYNVGEFDSGTKNRFKNTQDGVNAYYNLMANDYLSKSTPDDLMYSFVNKNGNRYASNTDYEKLVGQQRQYINKYLATK